MEPTFSSPCSCTGFGLSKPRWESWPCFPEMLPSLRSGHTFFTFVYGSQSISLCSLFGEILVKIYFGVKEFADLTPHIKKFKDEKFLLPASDKLNDDVPQTLDSLGVNWSQGIFFRTAMSDLSDLRDVKYDILCFFSPTGINSLFKNFPDFVQGNTRIAVFGSTTKKEAEDNGLRIDIMAPAPEAPSMTMALDKYIQQANK